MSVGEIAPRVAGAGSASIYNWEMPPGSMIPWFQASSSDPVPPGFALCNGQSATWLRGIHAGKNFTTPNMIGLFMIGGDILGGSSTANVSGFSKPTTQFTTGTTTHQHFVGGTPFAIGSGVQYAVALQQNDSSVSLEPASYALPWIIAL